MEQPPTRNTSLNTCIDFLQQLELIQIYNHDKTQPSEQIFADTYILKNIFKKSFCGRLHEIKRGKNAQHLKRLVLYDHDQPYKHIFLRNYYDRVKTSDTVLRKICTSHFIERVGKGYSRFYCEWELETEQRLQHIDPHSYGHQRLFPALQGCSTGGLGAHSAGCMLPLVTNGSGLQNWSPN